MARHNLSGTVIDSTDSRGIAGCDIILLRGDSIFSETKTASDGKFEIREIPGGEYTVEASALGYGLERRGIAVNGEQQLDIVMQPLKSTALDEVTVTADKSDIVTRTANGQIFYLSKEARALGNPFMALMEIPLLISDPNAASISTVYGDSPLVLINGNRVNSGISPIKPSEIESVEIVTNPSARYIREGYKSVVNIRLKPKSGPFTWIELATRHDLPVDYGFGVFQFEVGNPAVSVYGRVTGNYNHKEKTDREVSRFSDTYTQHFSESLQKDAGSVLGDVLLKGNPTKSDYYAIYGYADSKTEKQRYHGNGSLTNSSGTDYSYHGRSRDRSSIATASAYSSTILPLPTISRPVFTTTSTGTVSAMTGVTFMPERRIRSCRSCSATVDTPGSYRSTIRYRFRTTGNSSPAVTPRSRVTGSSMPSNLIPCSGTAT